MGHRQSARSVSKLQAQFQRWCLRTQSQLETCKREHHRVLVWFIEQTSNCKMTYRSSWLVWQCLSLPVVHSGPQRWQRWPGSDTLCPPSGPAPWTCWWCHLHCRPWSTQSWSLVASQWCKRSEGILRHCQGPSTEGQQRSLWCCSPLTDPWACWAHLYMSLNINLLHALKQHHKNRSLHDSSPL